MRHHNEDFVKLSREGIGAHIARRQIQTIFERRRR
jgi:hypothetical protein